MEEALVVRDTHAVDRVKPTDVVGKATEQANVLAELIDKQKLFSIINGRKYVRVEGWTPLARMNNVIPREISNERQDDGSYVARVQLVSMSDGTVLSEASGECGGPEEQTWQSRPPYARRSMAATRATGKACRLAYSWVMSLAGYEATPLEEVEGLGNGNEHHFAKNEGPVVPFGKNKGKSVSTLTDKQLDWYITTAEDNLNSPEYSEGGPKEKYRESEKAWLLALRVEKEARGA